MDCDLCFKLAAATERCIDLDKSFLERNGSLLKKKTNAKPSEEQECLMSGNFKLDFQTQIILDELNINKLEEHNLKTINCESA